MHLFNTLEDTSLRVLNKFPKHRLNNNGVQCMNYLNCMKLISICLNIPGTVCSKSFWIVEKRNVDTQRAKLIFSWVKLHTVLHLCKILLLHIKGRLQLGGVLVEVTKLIEKVKLNPRQLAELGLFRLEKRKSEKGLIALYHIIRRIKREKIFKEEI